MTWLAEDLLWDSTEWVTEQEDGSGAKIWRLTDDCYSWSAWTRNKMSEVKTANSFDEAKDQAQDWLRK